MVCLCHIFWLILAQLVCRLFGIISSHFHFHSSATDFLSLLESFFLLSSSVLVQIGKILLLFQCFFSLVFTPISKDHFVSDAAHFKSVFPLSPHLPTAPTFSSDCLWPTSVVLNQSLDFYIDSSASSVTLSFFAS